MKQDKVLSLKKGSAIGYLFNNEIYDLLSDEMSIEIFFRLGYLQNKYPNVFLSNDSGSGGFRLYETDYRKSLGGVVFSVNTGFGNVTAKAFSKKKYYLRGRWNHVVAVFRSGIVYLYHNGTPVAASVGNGDVIGEIMHPAPPDQTLFVGGDINMQVGFVRIFNTALDENEIMQRYECIRKKYGKKVIR